MVYYYLFGVFLHYKPYNSKYHDDRTPLMANASFFKIPEYNK